MTKKQHRLNGERLREANERERREMTRKALWGSDYPAIREAEAEIEYRKNVQRQESDTILRKEA